MSKTYILILLFSFTVCFQSCKKVEEYQINSEEDLTKYFEQNYIKVHFNSTDFKQQACTNLNFEFDDVTVIKVSESKFKNLIKNLKSEKLDPLQVDGQFDMTMEVQGVKYCLNNLGQIFRNKRKLIDNPDLVYDIKSDVGFYNYFNEEILTKNDSVIAKKGVPFSYKPYEPEVSGELLEDNTINKKVQNLKTSHNIIITYK